MTATGKQKIVTPPNNLLKKMGGKITGIDWQAIERANRSVAGIQGMIADNMLQDLKKLNHALHSYLEDFPVEKPEDTELYNKAFETKGLAGTIGYDLIGKVCASLCDMLDKCGQDHNDFITGLNAHVQAIQIILSSGDMDETAPVNRELLSGLGKMIDKMAC
ncbi:hypothetical protein [Emcibacter sp.]|uniref:hypothetical protein n=1 Tax=Emcibacter sp. TaxID=1979954 RepID=UPI002AA8150E|nr:hypothetical protein [Emcibacter sp.]